MEMTLGAVLYNLGRAMTYAVMGLVMGALGATVKLAGYQQSLSIATGAVLLLTLVLPSRIKHRLFSASPLGGHLTWLKLYFQKLIGIRSHASLFALGLVNGLLPCGLVYVALAGAVVTSDPVYGAVYMGLFGLGTLPMMLSITVAGHLLKVNWRQKLLRLIPVGVAVVSILLILRGLSLGIPYVSPKFNTIAPIHQHECAH
jgi:hypothetical protein